MHTIHPHYLGVHPTAVSESATPPGGRPPDEIPFSGDDGMKRLLTAALVLSFVGLARADDKANPTGTWKWTVTFNDQTREMTLKLKLDGDKLTGMMVRKDQETPIEDATFKDGEISFKVTRERNGQKFTTKYTGKVSGDTIKGKSESERDGQTQARDWEAKRSKD
jgi:hypothetical protein